MLEAPEDVFGFVPAEAEVSCIARGIKFAPGVLAAQGVAVELFAAEEVGDGIADEKNLRPGFLHGGAGERVTLGPVIAWPAAVTACPALVAPPA